GGGGGGGGLGWGDWGGGGGGEGWGDARPNRPGTHDEQQLGEENPADQHADRKILQRALLEFGEIDVKHHDDEQEKYRDRADIDDDQDHREEFGAHHHKQAGRIDERQNEKKNRMYRVSRSDHHHGAGHADAGKEIEEQRGDDHAQVSAQAWPSRHRRWQTISIAITCTARRARCSWRSHAPSGRRSRAGAPCRNRAPRGSRWR